MRRSFLFGVVFLLALIALTACGTASTPTVAPTSVPPTTAPTNTPVPTNTPAPTNTPTPTNTPKPTNTPRPTNTPAPTATPTATPAPVILKGSGSKVVDFDNPYDIAIAHITYTGGGNFVVRNYGDSPDYYDLLVNTIGRYDGIVPIDFGDSEHTTRFEIKASGPWTIEVKHAREARGVEVPGTFDGKGSDVIRLIGYDQNPPDIAHITHAGQSNFVVYGYNDSGRDLLVNEIGNYDGEVIVSPSTFLMVVKADGKWTIEVKTK